MEKYWLIGIAIGVFLTLNFLFYKALNVHYKNEFGKKMWKKGIGKLYFWQTSIFVSTLGTFLVMYLIV